MLKIDDGALVDIDKLQWTAGLLHATVDWLPGKANR
jgi:hypothetical protein